MRIRQDSAFNRIVQGGQIGKTYIVREFGKANYETVVYLDLTAQIFNQYNKSVRIKKIVEKVDIINLK